MRESNGATSGSSGHYLSNNLDDEDKLDDEKEDDADAQRDPVYYVNLLQYITDFLRSFCGQSYFPASFAPHINSQEKEVLGLIGIRLS